MVVPSVMPSLVVSHLFGSSGSLHLRYDLPLV